MKSFTLCLEFDLEEHIIKLFKIFFSVVKYVYLQFCTPFHPVLPCKLSATTTIITLCVNFTLFQLAWHMSWILYITCVSPSENHSLKEKNLMLETMAPLVLENDAVSQQLLDVILTNLLEPQKVRWFRWQVPSNFLLVENRGVQYFLGDLLYVRTSLPTWDSFLSYCLPLSHQMSHMDLYT